MNHKLHSTVGEETEDEIKYPRMVSSNVSGVIVVFLERRKGIVLHSGTTNTKPFERCDHWGDVDAEDRAWEIYNGPVTITGTDIN